MSDKSRRRIFLSPWHLEQIQCYNELFNHPLLIKDSNLQKMDFRGIFFSTMIQCGIEEFVMINCNPSRDLPQCNSEFLSKRIIFDCDLCKKYLQIQENLWPLFEEYFVRAQIEGTSDTKVHVARNFLTDMLFAMKTNLGSVAITSPTPDIERLKTTLNPELFYPLRNLILSIENDDLELPLPTQSISSQNVQRYEEIIDSEIFSNYAISHQNFQNSSITKPNAFAQIRKNATKIEKQFGHYVNLKNMAINSLHLIPTGVELFGGKIYGTVTEQLLKIIEPIFKDTLTNNRRIVTYKLSPITEDLLNTRFLINVKPERIGPIIDDVYNKTQNPKK